MSILVTGGAGYIGSHTVLELTQHKEHVVVIDSLVKGHRDAVLNAPLHAVDIRDTAMVIRILQEYEVDTVVHFAASSLVGESVSNPLKYYDDNVCATERLLSAMVTTGVKRIVFSSTAATYGEPMSTPITEDHPTVPTNPYGETKLAIERMLAWSYQAYGLQSISLRYFNAAGSHPSLPIGEDHHPETHLIPVVLQVPLGKRDHVTVYGQDYPTKDGTCVRDYVHVMDLASAHRLAVERLRKEDVQTEVFNLGIGQGFSVNEVIDTARNVTGHAIEVEIGNRRDGDPAVLVASSERAKRVLGWEPAYTDLSTMIASAWKFHQDHQDGYGH